MGHDPRALSESMTEFLRERHLASLTVLRPDGTPHVTPVGFTWDPETATVRIITWAGAYKVRRLEAAGGGRAAVCQVDGGRWLTLEGDATVTADPEECADAEARYAERYSPPHDRGADRRAILIAVDSVLGRA